MPAQAQAMMHTSTVDLHMLYVPHSLPTPNPHPYFAPHRHLVHLALSARTFVRDARMRVLQTRFLLFSLADVVGGQLNHWLFTLFDFCLCSSLLFGSTSPFLFKVRFR